MQLLPKTVFDCCDLQGRGGCLTGYKIVFAPDLLYFDCKNNGVDV